MLNINCILAYLVNKLRIAEEYGLCTDTLIPKLKRVSTYQWIYNNAWSCLSCIQQTDIENYIKRHFSNISFNLCITTEVECYNTLPPANDSCDTPINISYPNIEPSFLLNQHNTYICGVVDYPTQTSVPLPGTWSVDSTGDLWYTFNTGSSSVLSPYITVYNGTMERPQGALYLGSDCGTLSYLEDISATSGNSIVMHPTLLANTPYMLRISNAGGTTNSGTFSICISSIPII